MMLTMLCAGALIRSLASRPWVWIAVAGGLAGLTMLTKPEMALAGATTLAFGGSVVAVTRRDSVPKLAALMLLAATAFVSTPLLMGRTLCW